MLGEYRKYFKVFYWRYNLYKDLNPTEIWKLSGVDGPKNWCEKEKISWNKLILKKKTHTYTIKLVVISFILVYLSTGRFINLLSC